jgi:hypothetical protein
MCEPLLIGLLLQYIRYDPWQMGSSPKMHAMGGQFCKVLQESEMDASSLLCKLWKCCLDLQPGY